MGSPALVSVSCSTSYYYPPDCATALTRKDPKHAHTFSQEFSPLSHRHRPGHSQVLFLLDFMGTLKFSPGRERRHNNQSSCHQAPSARWSELWSETQPLEGSFPAYLIGTISIYITLLDYDTSGTPPIKLLDVVN